MQQQGESGGDSRDRYQLDRSWRRFPVNFPPELEIWENEVTMRPSLETEENWDRNLSSAGLRLISGVISPGRLVFTDLGMLV